MGRIDDDTAVLDPHLRVKGGGGSARSWTPASCPKFTSGNTNSPTLMIAEKAASWVLAGV